MTPTHFIDITIREAVIGRELHARLLTATHHMIKAGHAIGVTWPDWKQEGGEFGLLFRAFGTKDGLDSLTNTAKPLTNAGMVRFYAPGIVPETDLHVKFVRDRRMDKFSPSRFARLNARSAGRGEECPPRTAIRPSKSPHFLQMKSSTTGNDFSLYVTRSNGIDESEGGTKYGLGYSLPDF